MLTTFNDDPDLHKKVITADKSRVYGYDNETKVQSSQWKRPEEPRSKKAQQVQSNVNVLLIVFCSCFDFLLSLQSQPNAFLSSVSSVLGRRKVSDGQARSIRWHDYGFIFVQKLKHKHGALSWCKIYVRFFHNAMRFKRITSYSRRVTSRHYSIVFLS